MIPNDKLTEISRKYLDGTISEDERKMLLDWYNEYDEKNICIVIKSNDLETEESLEVLLLQRIQDKIRSNSDSE